MWHVQWHSEQPSSLAVEDAKGVADCLGFAHVEAMGSCNKGGGQHHHSTKGQAQKHLTVNIRLHSKQDQVALSHLEPM